MNLKQIRAQKGLTVQQLADLAELPKRTVENILRNGDCLVSNAIKLADALGVTLDELCRDNPEQTETEYPDAVRQRLRCRTVFSTDSTDSTDLGDFFD